MAQPLALVDASPLIGLAHVGGLGWLRKLYRKAAITPTVRSEVLTGLNRLGEREIGAAIRARQISVLAAEPSTPSLPGLGDGEATTLRAALAHGAGALVILDDLSARRAAQRSGIAVVGTAAVIVDAKRARLIKAARPLFERLLDGGFRISDALVEAVLVELGER